MHASSTASTATAETNVIDTLQSLTIAFALAMAVRSFVTEGFVIPTGSMAPTLLGQHIKWKSPQTGYDVAVDPRALFASRASQPGANAGFQLFDPMLSTTHSLLIRGREDLIEAVSMGDRVLVLKFLYAFCEPKRWDVVVFKNPPDPVGDTQNYIKRLVGLPNEQLLLIDGDVWTAPLNATSLKEFHIARKPDYVQRAVWQPVHDSDYVPIEPQSIKQMTQGRMTYSGPPWRGDGWDTSGRSYRHEGAGVAQLTWDWNALKINDYAAYNMLSNSPVFFPVSDLRIATAIEADDPGALSMQLELDARSHLFVWQLKNGRATISIRHKESGELLESKEANAALPGRGRACDLECWHVDQHMGLWLNGKELVGFDYDQWTPEQRIGFSRFGSTLEQYRLEPADSQNITPPQISWSFGGSSVTLHRVRVDRDLYYRPGTLSPEDQVGVNGQPISGPAFGTDVDHPAHLKADQFLMLGDNSSQSRDGRLWGRPSPIVTEQLGESSPFIVPRDLLLGKAWCVYFPSPLPAPTASSNKGMKVVPPFGSVRFIR